MRQHATRIIIVFIALLFVATALVPLLQVWQEHNANKATIQKEAKVNPHQLQGTKLANFTPVQSVPSLQEIDLQPGTGPTVKPGQAITVDYTGAVASTGVIFQSSKDTGQPATLALNQVIAGWSQGIPGMKVGGTRRLLIPAALAYGSNPPQGSGIPADADLVFDVTVHSIVK